MKYLVMECGLSYAIVLDENGKFLKIANLNYQVGQEITEIIPFEEKKKVSAKKVISLTAIAACLCLISLLAFQLFIYPVGTVRVQINPDVQMQVNQMHYVVGLEGLNDDGNQLIENVSYWWRKVEDVADELADRAMYMGYLTQGGEISLTVDSDNSDWKVATEETIVAELEVHLQHSVTITVTDNKKLPDRHEEESTASHQIVITVPVNPTPDAPQVSSQQPDNEENPQVSIRPTPTQNPTPKPTTRPSLPSVSPFDDDEEDENEDEEDEDDEIDGEDDEQEDDDDDEEDDERT